MVRRSISWSVPAGSVVAQPCRERKVAGTVTSSSDAASARTAADLGGELVLGAGVDGQVQAEAEQLALAPGQPVGQVAGVVGGGLGVRVVEPAPVGAVRGGRIPGGRAGGAAGRRRPRAGIGSMCSVTSRRPG